MRRTRTLILALVVVAGLAACGGDDSGSDAAGNGGAGEGAAAAAEAVDVSIAEFKFAPETVEVAVGSTITWTNADEAPHSVAGADDAFDSDPSLAKGDTFEHTFTDAGTFEYVCGIHNYMTGTVEVS